MRIWNSKTGSGLTQTSNINKSNIKDILTQLQHATFLQNHFGNHTKITKVFSSVVLFPLLLLLDVVHGLYGYLHRLHGDNGQCGGAWLEHLSLYNEMITHKSKTVRVDYASVCSTMSVINTTMHIITNRYKSLQIITQQYTTIHITLQNIPESCTAAGHGAGCRNPPHGELPLVPPQCPRCLHTDCSQQRKRRTVHRCRYSEPDAAGRVGGSGSGSGSGAGAGTEW